MRFTTKSFFTDKFEGVRKGREGGKRASNVTYLSPTTTPIDMERRMWEVILSTPQEG